jgi:uncharacterized membrane protein YhaH (DUF805 family)
VTQAPYDPNQPYGQTPSPSYGQTPSYGQPTDPSQPGQQYNPAAPAQYTQPSGQSIPYAQPTQAQQYTQAQPAPQYGQSAPAQYAPAPYAQPQAGYSPYAQPYGQYNAGYAGFNPAPTPTDPGLALPWYGIGFVPAFIRMWKKFATFSGRASRGEFWWAFLAYMGIEFVFGILLGAAGMDIRAAAYGDWPYNGFGTFLLVVMSLYGLAMIVPYLALTVRRLHDTGRAGTYWFISLIPFVGSILLLVALAGESKPEGLKYP